MKTDCNVIRDLLPLYADEVCSSESREIVDEHLAECPACTEELARIRENEIESHLAAEKEDVIRYQKKKFGRRSAAVGSVIAWILMIPVVICLFLNRLEGGRLDWFFVVVAGLAVAASVIVVPLMVPENKLFWTFCAFCASTVLLLAVTCIYSHGDWFFIAASAFLFGMSLFFLPFAIRAKPLRPYVPERKAFTVVAVDVALFAVMMECISIHKNGLGFWRGAVLVGILIGLVVAVVIPEMKKRGIIK